jgi:hypothetical protein
MRSKIGVGISLLLIAAVLTACGGVASAKSLNDSIAAAQEQSPLAQVSTPGAVTRTISVSGSGKVYVVPDIAYVTIGVHTEGKDAAKAVADNNTTSTAVKEAIKELGVEDKDIQTVNFSIYPQQQFDQNGRPTGDITYMVDNMIMVTVRDLAKIGDILDAAVTAGANTVSGIQFSVADKSKAESEARKLAVENAEQQAQELAQAAGVNLGPVQIISSIGGVVPVPVYEKGLGGGGAPAAAPSVPVSPGQMVVQIDVQMVYEIK